MPSDRTTETCEACSPERLLRGSFRYYRTDKKWFGGVRLIEKPKKVVEDTHWVNYNEFYHI